MHQIIRPKSVLRQHEAMRLVESSRPEVRAGEDIVVVDLFSGAGGMTAGALMASSQHNAGFRIVYAADMNEDARAVYLDNFGPYFEGIFSTQDMGKMFSGLGKNVSRYERDFESRAHGADLLMAGPPCQGHSDLNNVTRRSDPRNALYLSAIRAIEVSRPKMAIVENVPGVVHSSDDVVGAGIKHLMKIGYNTYQMMVNFIEYGIPQSRVRHVLLASSAEIDFSGYGQEEGGGYPTLRPWIGSLVERGHPVLDRKTSLSPDNIERINYLFDHDIYDLPDAMRPFCHRFGGHSYRAMYGRLSFDKPAQTITSGFGSPGQGRHVHPEERRTLSCREAARIQAFPDWFSFSKAKGVGSVRQLIANGVPPVFTYSIVDYLLRSDYFIRSQLDD